MVEGDSGVTDDTEPVYPAPSAALLDEVTRDLAALASTRRRLFVIFAVVVTVALSGLALYASARAGAGDAGAPGLGQPLHSTVLVAFGALGMILYGLAFGLWFPSRERLIVWIGAGMVGCLGLLITTSIGYGHLGEHQDGYVCLAEGSGIGLVVGLLTLVGGGALLRRRAPTGGLLGVAVGVLSLAPLHLVCIDASMPHLLFWHGATPLLCALVVSACWVFLRGED